VSNLVHTQTRCVYHFHQRIRFLFETKRSYTSPLSCLSIFYNIVSLSNPATILPPYSATLHHPVTGPVHAFISSLLTDAARSSRLLLLLGLQLTGLLARTPSLAPYYTSALVTLACLGYDEDESSPVAGEVALDVEAAHDMHAMLAPLDPGLAAAYAGTTVAPRVTVLCVLRQWVVEGEGGNGAAREAAGAVWRELLQLALTDPDLTETKCGIPTKSIVHT
jgi:hypothetical protein